LEARHHYGEAPRRYMLELAAISEHAANKGGG
jgi:hypothetical protein